MGLNGRSSSIGWSSCRARSGIALPALGNEVMVQMKSTALISTITLLDLTGVARRIVTRTYSTEPLFVAGAIYIALTFLIARGFRLVETRLEIPR
jgi:ABC-type arginine/histidine transport system permease subunit